MGETVIEEFFPVDHVISVGVDLVEKVLKVFLDGVPPEGFSAFEALSEPSFELASLEEVISVDIVTEEDLFDEGVAIGFAHLFLFECNKIYKLMIAIDL